MILHYSMGLCLEKHAKLLNCGLWTMQASKNQVWFKLMWFKGNTYILVLQFFERRQKPVWWEEVVRGFRTLDMLIVSALTVKRYSEATTWDTLYHWRCTVVLAFQFNKCSTLQVSNWLLVSEVGSKRKWYIINQVASFPKSNFSVGVNAAYSRLY